MNSIQQSTPVSSPERIGAYRIIRRIGAGGMGEVFEGRNDQIGRRVALKLLHRSSAQQRMALVRFETEARAANCVQHPCVVPITEIGQTDDGCRYLVMEYVEGETLRAAQRAEPGPWPELRVLRLAVQLASVLATAHAQHVIHRDLKPSNIMLLRDPDVPGGLRVKLLDFGIAKLCLPRASSATSDAAITETEGREGPRTSTGALLGTPLYMSPEQCRDSSGVTEHTDVYSLGVVLYELLAGQPPFVADSDVMLLLRHVEETERPLRERAAGVSSDLAALVHSMLRKRPTDRPTMSEVERRIRSLLQGDAAEHRVPTVGPQPDAGSRDSRRIRLSMAVLVCVLLLLAAGLFGVHAIRRAQHALPDTSETRPQSDSKQTQPSRESEGNTPRPLPSAPPRADAIPEPAAPSLQRTYQVPASRPPSERTQKGSKRRQQPPSPKKESHGPHSHVPIVGE